MSTKQNKMTYGQSTFAKMKDQNTKMNIARSK